MLLIPPRKPKLFTADAIKRYDPTGTGPIRQRFERDVVRRFRQLRSAIIKAVGTDDVLDLGTVLPKVPGTIGDALQTPPPKAFQFQRRADKVASFNSWLQEAQDKGILEVQTGTPLQSAASQSWMNTYIDSAYQKGIRDAGAKLKKAGATVDDYFLRSAFNRPIHADAVGLLYTRAFNDLDGITKTMDQQISRVLAQGMIEGRGPMDIARKLADRVDGIGIVRARTLARTETIAAHAESTLNMFEEAGVEGVELEAEFTTAGDDAVCPECEDLEGEVYSIEEARGVIPVHPNCRCAFLPVVK
jgi:SPP1 gp7 family putative phage head morphogenesis protein